MPERARSISPQKSSPANTPPSSTHRIDTSHGSFTRLTLDSSPAFDPFTSLNLQSSPKNEDMAAPEDLSTSPSKENELPVDSEHKHTGQTSPTRSGSIARGLSWQKRPNSQISERSRSRPLSMVAAENAARNSPSEPTSATETVSRDQIASALSSKDPSWFRQTADRGTGSAAYRRNQVEGSQPADMSLASAQLPGMSRIPSSEISRETTTPQPASPALQTRLASPLPLSSTPKLDPPSTLTQPETEVDEDRSQIMGPPSGRTSPSKMERSGSPTKGMGGFVQSAMMKRSDSIKRWSVQSPSASQRADPIATHRTGYDSPSRTSGHARSKSRPASLIRDPSTEVSPRRSPSQDVAHQGENVSNPEKSAESLRLEIKPLSESQEQEQESGRVTPPVSPSKTMDSRRWSPTKASWLESALNKPESPKPKHNPSSSQPAWMAELQKAKAEKAANPSVERSRSPTISHKHQVSIGGLMRSSAPGITAKPVGLGINSSTSVDTTVRSDKTGSAPKSLRSPTTPGLRSPDLEPSSRSASIDSSSSSTKPKPEAPPKKDFRANLKPRQAPTGSDVKEESEFKNVFGKLRKTTTQNYVAPDELKSNIMRGKAALNLTGGPKKTERVDEFKEAILAKKKDFQKVQSEGRGITRTESTASEKPVPEGLLKRGELGRSNTLKRGSASSDAITADIQKLGITSKHDSVQEPPPSKPQRLNSNESRGSPQEPTASKVERPSFLNRNSTQTTPASKDINPTVVAPKETTGPARLQGKVGGGVLANRFNPALAGLIARGPPSAAPASSTTGASSNSQSNTTAEVNDNEAGSGPKLTHMTKSRARGPKRKAPTTAPTSAPVAISDEPEVPPISQSKSEAIAVVDSSKIGHDRPTRPRPEPISLTESSKKLFEPTPKEIPSKTPTSSSKIHEQVAAFATQRRQPSPTKAIEEPKESTSQPPSPRKLDMKRMSQFFNDTKQATEKTVDTQRPKNTETEPEIPLQTKPKPTFEKPASPDIPKTQPQSPSLSKPKRPLPDPTSMGLKGQPPIDPIVSSPSSEIPGATFSVRPLPTIPAVARPEPAPSSRPLPMEPKKTPRPLPTPRPKSPGRTASPTRSPTKQAAEASTLLGDFFGPERPQRSKYNVDAAELLEHRPSITPSKIQTLSAQLFQFSADGKKMPVPTHHERTLFEREMYLCSHTFKDESGKKLTEVYFWAGDEVPHSTVEDASIFVSREARSFGGKLIKLKQGKETAEFLQALGGIVIVQRGSGNKFDSLAPHMLCGRRYLGHVVFDEVDFSPAVLCSGFPYVVTTAGKCYLWKGKGSGVDELSCARLIGMDYALSGELEEIEDGREQATFWNLFDANSKAVSADHWRLKPNYDKYCSRLFCSDAASKQQVSYAKSISLHKHTLTHVTPQIVEISPFSQTDLQPTKIYVLDAFFELYIIVGSRAQAQYASFHNALDFAQEYGILAAGMEDRPFVPFSTVVLEGIPRDMKSVFRKWRDAESPTITNVNTGLKRGRSLRVVPLNQALQALSD